MEMRENRGSRQNGTVEIFLDEVVGKVLIARINDREIILCTTFLVKNHHSIYSHMGS